MKCEYHSLKKRRWIKTSRGQKKGMIDKNKEDNYYYVKKVIFDRSEICFLLC